MNTTIESQLSFLCEIDKLKNVIRKSPLTDQSRRENSAEHSWHLAMYALVLSDHANTNIDVGRVIKMLLIHDIVEIDAGDHPIHENVDLRAQEQLERNAAERLFGILPGSQAEELQDIWREFEEGESDDACFAKALDRLQPIIHNVVTAGGTWSEAKVNYQQVQERYGPTIRGGSLNLWAYAKQLVTGHFNEK